MFRRLRNLQRKSDSDSDFETPALRAANNAAIENHDDESDDSDEKSESGLGDSPEEEMIEEHADEDDSDDKNSDDDAPEDVGFTSSRESEKKRMQTILQQIHKSREETKEKRRKKDELFKLQKQDKLAALSKRKLPAEILEAVAGKAAKQKKTAKDGKTGQSKTDSESADPMTPSDPVKEDVQSGSEVSGSEDKSPGSLGDFILLSHPDKSHEVGDVTVIALSTCKRQSGPVSQNVADFRQKMLYSKHIKRIPSQQLRAAEAKRKART